MTNILEFNPSKETPEQYTFDSYTPLFDQASKRVEKEPTEGAIVITTHKDYNHITSVNHDRASLVLTLLSIVISNALPD